MALTQEIPSESGGRVKGVTIVKPIVFGNYARYFGKKREEDGHTHEWTVYLKPYLNEDISKYVRKVHFKLHDSYSTPNRIITKPPFEVAETGWGEFEISIKIYFYDPNERPVNLYHILKLFQGSEVANAATLGKHTIVSEFYEELIFQEPTQNMLSALSPQPPLTTTPYIHHTNFEDKKEKTLASILVAKNKIRREINEYKDKLKLAKETISKFKSEIAKQQLKNAATSGVV
ncbi:hypothetical protein LSTR_LSTR008429 [Laodelphax striatellus]|uniref:YEATS domain-containing protein n=1 Tax=Laodelphax striatellus TaxID=195883 RepID=A0A482XT05_LAOST|nr:hypothetical protein LSTR_LSTR008429 [Laodelphax striatellus]